MKQSRPYRNDSTARIKRDIERNDKWLRRARGRLEVIGGNQRLSEAIANTEELQRDLRAELARR